MKASAANRRRATWPPRDFYSPNPPHHGQSPEEYVRENMDAIADNVRRTCSEAYSDEYGGIRLELDRTIQAANSQRQGKETV
jgi:hypothetical protein